MRTQLVPLALLLCAAASAPAQVIFGSIQGTVVDESNAAVPGATVKARNADTGVVVATRSNQTGRYFIGEVRPGNYVLEADAPGFSQFVRRGLTVRIEDNLRLDIRLQIGQVTDRVEVTAAAPLVESERTTLGKVVEEKPAKELPIGGRNIFSLVNLTPGVQKRSDDEQPRLSGGRARTGEVALDGSSMTDPRRGEVKTQPNLDAIQEVKVQTSGLSAEFGRTAGGIVNATLKSGTNEFHGNLFEFLRNDNLNARNTFFPTVPKLAQNQFGGMIGGPVRKDRTFFFADYEGFRSRAESSWNLTIPVPAFKQGDFSQILGRTAGSDALGRPIADKQVFDPATTRAAPNGRLVRDPFPGNRIPASRFDPAGAKAVNLYPVPNGPGLTQNYQTLKPRGVMNNKFDVRIDPRISDKDQFFSRFSFDVQDNLRARAYDNSATVSSGNFDRYKTGATSWSHIFNPAHLNDLRFSFFRGYLERKTNFSLTPTDFGIPNLGPLGMPRFGPVGYDTIGDVQIFGPAQEQYQIQDVATHITGRHILKFGADVRRIRVNDLQLTDNGSYGFNTLQTGDPYSALTGHPVASMLLGLANSFTNDPNTGRFYHRSSYAGVFVQDDFKLTSSFTLNAGLRYDVEQQPNEIRWNGSNFDLAGGRVVTMRELGRNRIQLTDRNNLSPRFGFAWRPFGRNTTVIRSHYGIFVHPLIGRATSAFGRFPQSQIFTVQSDGVNPAVVLTRTPAPPPNPEGLGLTHSYRDPNAPSPYFQQWNFDIQQQLPMAVLLQASYSANAGKHIPKGVTYNQIRIEDSRAAGRGTQDMRPYPRFANIDGQDERGSSNYQSLQLSAERRFSGGLYFLAAYTFSKLIDDVEDVFGAVGAIDAYNLRLEKGLSYAHYPHRFVASGLYELPVGRGKPLASTGLLSRLAGNWTAGWVMVFQSGDQVAVTQSANTARNFSSSFRPDRVSDPVLPVSERTLGRWFNTGAFSPPAPFAIGNSPIYPDIQGPGQATLDLSLLRLFPLPLNEQSRLELRGECFNCTNRVNYGPPAGGFNTPNFGRVTSAGAGRAVQVAMKFWF